jgi:hypothetical protein
MITDRQAIPDCISVNINITDENQSGKGFDIQIFATIPVIGRQLGPVLQDMGTTRERRRIVQVDATARASQRSPGNETVKDACITVAKKYGPTATSKIFKSNLSSSWDANAGHASATLEWTYE